MHKKNRIALLISISFFPLFIKSMSPSQIAQQQQRFNKKVQEYKKEIEENGLSLQAETLFKEALTLLDPIKKFVNASKLQQELIQVAATKQQALLQNVTPLLLDIINFLEPIEKMTLQAPKDSPSYYKELVNSVIKNGQAITDNFFKKTIPFTQEPFITQCHKHMDMVFRFMNMLGTTDGQQPYGKSTFANFISSEDELLSNLQAILTKVYDFAQIGSSKKDLLDITKKSGKTVFGLLDTNLKNYDLFVHQIMESSNIQTALKKIEDLISSIKIAYPILQNDSLVIENNQPKYATTTFSIKTKEGEYRKLADIAKDIVTAMNNLQAGYKKLGEAQATPSILGAPANVIEQEISTLAQQKTTLSITTNSNASLLNLNKDLKKLWDNLPIADRPTSLDVDVLQKWLNTQGSDEKQNFVRELLRSLIEKIA